MTNIKPHEEFQIEVFHRQFLRESISLFGKCFIWALIQTAMVALYYIIAAAAAAGGLSSAIAGISIFFILIFITSGVAYIIFTISEIVKLINYHTIIKKNENELLSRISAIEIKSSTPKGL